MNITWELCKEYGKEYLMFGYLSGNPVHEYAIKKTEDCGFVYYSLFKRIFSIKTMCFDYDLLCTFIEHLGDCQNRAVLDLKK